MEPVKPGTIKETREFISKYDGVDGFKLYGFERFIYQFISDNYPEDIEFDPKLVKKLYLDIEVSSENGFPKPEEASEPVTAITVSDGKRYFVFGLKDYKPHKENIHDRKCNSEHELLHYFVKFWVGFEVDIVTGWNTKFFDIPYLVNRIKALLGCLLYTSPSPRDTG